MTLLLVAAVAGLSAPPAVSVDTAAVVAPRHTSCRSHGLHSRYMHLYRAVRRENGPRAPGRNIWDEGLRPGDPSRCRDVRRSAAALKRIHFPGVQLLTPSTPVAPPAGVPTPRATSAPLAAIRQCESGGDYSTNTGNGFAGAYQFTPSTWASVGGSGSPAAASPAEQDRRAAMLYAREGSAPWPVCGR
jgi:hypothetical protein